MIFGSGDIMNEKRNKVILKDVLGPKGYIRGPFGSALKRGELLDKGIPVYEQQHAITESRTFRFYINDEKFESMKRFQVQENDLIISCSGTIGCVSIIGPNDPKGSISQALLILRANTDVVLPQYLKYFFTSKKGYNAIVSRSSGSVQVNIAKREIIEQIELDLPDIPTQKKIVGVLEALDKKISNNNEINDNLLQQAQALYGRFFPYNVADELPAGWRVGTVGEIVKIHDSKRIPLSGAQRAKMEKRIYPYYGAASLMDYVDEYIFDGIYLLLGEDGTVIDDAGYPILQYVWGQFWVNNHAHILTGKLGFNVESLLLLFKRTPMKSIVTGAVQPKISQANLRSVQVVIPPQTELDAFNELIRPMFDQIRQNQDQNKALAVMRDALLPKLMSGDIDISDIQV